MVYYLKFGNIGTSFYNSFYIQSIASKVLKSNLNVASKLNLISKHDNMYKQHLVKF